MTRVVFVTGTDTGVGKTVVTAALAAAYRAQDLSVCVVKPTQTGVAPDEAGDLDEVVRLAGPVTTVEPVRLAHPLAPDLAARVAGVGLPGLEEQAAVVVRAAAAHDLVLVEGAGGVTVRLGEGWSLLDLAGVVGESLRAGPAGPVGPAAPIAVGVVLVARSGLGTLNHSVLTMQALRAAGLGVHGLVLGSWPVEPGLTELLNRDELPGLTGAALLGVVPAGASALAPMEFQGRARSWFDTLP